MFYRMNFGITVRYGRTPDQIGNVGGKWFDLRLPIEVSASENEAVIGFCRLYGQGDLFSCMQ
jgi:hypothetical protein